MTRATPAAVEPPPSAPWGVIVATGAIAAVLQAANLRALALHFGCDPWSFTCPGAESYWFTNDTPGYVDVARGLLERGPFGASYLVRTPGYGALIAVSLVVFGHPFAALWAAPILAAAAGMATAWTAFAFAGRRRAAVLAGLLFCLWPNAYQYASMLMTDTVHAFLSVIAFALTVAWRRSERAPLGWLAALGWMATQTIRPTFFPLPVALPFLLWRRHSSPAYARLSIALWLATGIVPAGVVASNYLHHGVALASVVEPETLACYAIPRMQEEMGLGDFAPLRAAALERYAAVADLRERVALERRDAWELIGAHPGLAISSLAGEMMRQLFTPLHPWYLRNLADLYPAWMTPPAVTIQLYWLCAALGLVILARREPQIAIFLALAFFLVMVPATTSHWVFARLRLPLDLLFLPVVALLLSSPGSLRGGDDRSAAAR